MLPITQDLLTNKKNRPAMRDSYYFIKKLKGIVIHWTANPFKGATAKANRNYFNNGERYASAHYVVDANTIIQCIPDEEVAYHVGASSYRPQGIKLMENLTPNFFLVGIEMCINEGNDWAKTYQNALELTRYLLEKHNLTVDDVYRHYDITGKDCPKMMIDEKLWNQYLTDLKKSNNITLNIPFRKWEDFKADVNSGLTFSKDQVIKKGIVNTADLNVRKGNGTEFPIVDKLKQNDKVEIYSEIGNWLEIGDDRWVGKNYVQITFSTQDGIIASTDKANIRKGPGKDNPVVETLNSGTPIKIIDQYDGWYQIGDNKWVHQSLVKLSNVRNGKINVPEQVNVRSGAGTNFAKVKSMNGGTLVKVLDEQNGWYKIGDNEWVFASYVDILS